MIALGNTHLRACRGERLGRLHDSPFGLEKSAVKTLYAVCQRDHWGEVQAPVPDLKTHTLWCTSCGHEMDPNPQLAYPPDQGYREDHRVDVRVTED